MSISHDELKRAQQIARDLRITQEREDEINPHPEELHRTAEKAARLIEEWALRLEWQQRDLERMRLLTRKHGEQSWADSRIYDAEELLQKVQQLERENARLQMELDASCNAEELRQVQTENAALRRDVYQWPPTSENGYEGLTWAEAFAVIERDNAELHNKLATLQHQSQWQCSCGGTDCEGQKENAALRQQLEDVKRVRYSLEDALTCAHDEAEACWQDKERLDWIASRKSTQFVYFAVAGWAIIKASGCDLLHECNIHDLRAAIDAARAKEAQS